MRKFKFTKTFWFNVALIGALVFCVSVPSFGAYLSHVTGETWPTGYIIFYLGVLALLFVLALGAVASIYVKSQRKHVQDD